MNFKKCGKCGKNFECNADNISECRCSTVNLNEHHRKIISEKFSDCLCMKCLSEIKNETVVIQ